MRLAPLWLLLGFACHKADAPPADAATPPPIPGPATADECGAEAAAQGLSRFCYYEVRTLRYCGGTPPPSPDYGARHVCVCHDCETDNDCDAGDKCLPLHPVEYCSVGPRNVCVPPEDACFPGNTCPDGLGCMDSGDGPTCARPMPGPP